MTTNLKILILEDNPADVDLLIRELKKSKLSFTSEVVQTREAFQNAIQNFKPDLILSDYSLPSFDGLTAFHIKQEKIPEIPFIIISGTIGEENAVELIKIGVTDYALKGKLFTLNPKIIRALFETKEKKEKGIAVEKLKIKNEKLLEICSLQSHQVRRPIASILGLISLFDFNDPNAPLNTEIMLKLDISAKEFDSVIHEIVQKTSELKNII
ncbi:MAG: hypothetical protein A3F72_13380 [Bacteroidetes bacterium RIFCSPLOWO2_12_FULL_35_15]|nr:MAG: hypothetical protein A3F72_13380 [Bacteroidetes bacterium RIFCSPLOWO2_12_FULL_35_15]